MRNLRRVSALSAAAVLLLSILFPFGAMSAEEQDEREEGFFELFDDAGRSLTMTARILAEGDGYISADNRYYVVDRIDGDKVQLKFKEIVELPEVEAFSLLEKPRSTTASIGDVLGNLFAQAGRGQEGKDTIAIYVTHSDESYVPTSGKASEEKGDIYNVAHALGEALKDLGFNAIVSDNSHLPRDGEAYLRSRRTAFDLVKKYQPATIIDVHRDAVPAKIYRTEVNGQEMTKVRLVVGRQNQNRDANLEYAKRIKAYADRHYPGLIEGIFDARGNYNQDLSPRAILLEFGTHTTPEEHAKAAAQIMAKVLPAAAGLTGARDNAQTGRREQAEQRKQQAVSYIGAAGTRTLWWIVGIGAVIVVGLVLINGTKGKHIKGFFRQEFSEGDRQQRSEKVGVPNGSHPTREDDEPGGDGSLT